MAIKRGGKDTGSIYYGKRAIQSVYKGTRLVWEAIRSCFGRGVWINNKGWVNKDGWRNH